MGWGRYLLLGDLGQQLDLSDQKQEIDQLREELQRRRRAGEAPTGEIARLQTENDELRLYLVALVRLFVAKGVISPDDIKQCVEAIDLEDGVRDGRYSSPIQ